jgi:hypothetical protein
MMWQYDHGFGVESKRDRMYRVVLHVAFGVTVAGLIAAVFGYFVMLLWNGVLPQVTAARSISYWQAVGLLLLARILVGGLKGHGGCHGHGYRHGKRSWREYDQWWNEVGRQSFETFAGTPKEPGEQ